jgi:hypothetical protein
MIITEMRLWLYTGVTYRIELLTSGAGSTVLAVLKDRFVSYATGENVVPITKGNIFLASGTYYFSVVGSSRRYYGAPNAYGGPLISDGEWWDGAYSADYMNLKVNYYPVTFDNAGILASVVAGA